MILQVYWHSINRVIKVRSYFNLRSFNGLLFTKNNLPMPKSKRSTFKQKHIKLKRCAFCIDVNLIDLKMEHQLCGSFAFPHSQSISTDDVFREDDLKSGPTDVSNSANASGGILATSWNRFIWRRLCSRSSYNVLSREWLTLCNSDNLKRNFLIFIRLFYKFQEEIK